jgi:hypothetical protein
MAYERFSANLILLYFRHQRSKTPSPNFPYPYTLTTIKVLKY